MDIFDSANEHIKDNAGLYGGLGGLAMLNAHNSTKNAVESLKGLYGEQCNCIGFLVNMETVFKELEELDDLSFSVALFSDFNLLHSFNFLEGISAEELGQNAENHRLHNELCRKLESSKLRLKQLGADSLHDKLTKELPCSLKDLRLKIFENSDDEMNPILEVHEDSEVIFKGIKQSIDKYVSEYPKLLGQDYPIDSNGVCVSKTNVNLCLSLVNFFALYDEANSKWLLNEEATKAIENFLINTNLEFSDFFELGKNPAQAFMYLAPINSSLGHIRNRDFYFSYLAMFEQDKEYKLAYLFKDRKKNVLDGLHKDIEKAESGGSCFVATAVYEDSKHQQVQKLRSYRDGTLNKSVIGRIFVRFYYHVGPRLAIFPKKSKLIKSILRNLLDRF